MFFRICFLWIFFSLLVGCLSPANNAVESEPEDKDKESSGPAVGEEGGPCNPDGECFGDLVCQSNICVDGGVVLGDADGGVVLGDADGGVVLGDADGGVVLGDVDGDNDNDDNNNNNSDDGGVTDNNYTSDSGVIVDDNPALSPCRDADEDGFYFCIPDDLSFLDGGTIPEELDCDDSLWHVQPGGAEVPGNRIDDNCNGIIDEIEDGCPCYYDDTQSAEAMASAIGLCGDRLLSATATGKLEQRNAQAGYFGVAPRAGACFSALSTGKAVPNDSMGSISSEDALHFISNDMSASFECQIDDGGWSSCVSPYAFPSFASGIHKLMIRAKDSSGNKDPMPLVYKWNAETDEILPSEPEAESPSLPSPNLSLSYPVDAATLKDTTPYIGGYGPQGEVITVTFTNTSNNYSFSIDTGVGMTGRWVIDESLWNGQILNASTWSITVESDISGTIPGIQITIDENSAEPEYTSADITLVDSSGADGAMLTFTASDTSATFECRMDANPWQTCTSPYTYDQVGTDVHIFYVRALLDGEAELVPDGFIWQAPATGFALLSPADGASTSESRPAFIGRGYPGFYVQLVLQRISGATVLQEWAQSTSVGIDGRWVFLSPAELNSGTYQVVYSVPELFEDTHTISFTQSNQTTDTVAPATLTGGNTSVQPGGQLGSQSPDPNPADSSGDTVWDLATLELEIKKPSNVSGFAFDFMFMSSEFPEYLCSPFNDTFYALGLIDSMGTELTNISFDADGNEITVNNAFFEASNAWSTPLYLTPFGAHSPDFCPITTTASQCSLPDYCEFWGSDSPAINTIGSGTGWLTTSVPLTEDDETFSLHFSVHDEYDDRLDSLVLFDNFRWLVEATDVTTEKPPDFISGE